MVVAIGDDCSAALQGRDDLPVEMISAVGCEQKREHCITNDAGFMLGVEDVPDETPSGSGAWFSSGDHLSVPVGPQPIRKACGLGCPAGAVKAFHGYEDCAHKGELTDRHSG